MTTIQRSAPRSRSLLKGRLIFPNRQSTMDCIVRDISDGGARLELYHNDLVPDHFDLYVPLKETTFPVEVRWRQNSELGVRFVVPREPGATQDDLAARVSQLEAEFQEMKSALSEIQARLMPH